MRAEYDVPTVQDLIYDCTEMRCEIEGITSDYDIYCVQEDYEREDGAKLYEEYWFLCDMMWK